MPNWTPEQRQAIEAENPTILVSAAAGSGKTAVLVERVIHLLRKGYPLDRMLIVTFTKAAASEMRERLNRRLLREARLDPEVMGQALDDLESCEISTIHAFCTHVLKNHFQAVGIDPMFRICEENDRQALFELAFRDAMNELLEADETVRAYVDAFGQDKARETVSAAYAFLMSMPDPFDWLDAKIASLAALPYQRQPWYQVLAEEARRQVDGIGDLLQAMEEMFHVEHAVQELRETWLADCATYHALREKGAASTQALYEALATTAFVKAVRCVGLSPEQKDWQKRYNALRQQMKDIVSQCAASLAVNEEKLTGELRMVSGHLTGLAALLRRTHALFLQSKQEKNVVDFADLEQMTCGILRDENTRGALQEAYDHLFVDECQDVSAIQDTILQALHGDNNCLFMVGDVKQSIYRFRLADPTRFLHRMRTFSDAPDAKERRIFLQRNFRSCASVLDAANRVFRHTFRRGVTELDYLPEDELIQGRESPDAPPVEIHLLPNEKPEDEDEAVGLEAEAEVLVRRIRELLNEKLEDGGVRRNYTYRDMVILLPKTAGVGAKLAELLTDAGVPVYFDGADSYFELPEIIAMKALLSVIDNPLQDIPLLAVLKMTPFSLTEEELANIRLVRTGRDVPFSDAFEACCEQRTPLGERCRGVKKRLADWRFEAETMPLSDFLWRILRESGYYAACGALPKGELRQANLRLLCQRAAEYEQSGGYTLSGFLELADRQQAAEDTRSAKTLGEGENLVRVMTMHKSKGLEFPVVFCLRLGGGFRHARQGDVSLHGTLGVLLPYVNRPLNIRRRTQLDAAFAVQRRLDEQAERARLLYVAMTRARERLILIGSVEEKKRGVWTLPESDYRVDRAACMMDWIMQGVLSDDPAALQAFNPSFPWRVEVWGRLTAASREQAEQAKNVREEVRRGLDAEPLPRWSDWLELDERPAAMPLKTSVSSLAKKTALRDPLPLTDDDESVEEKRQSEVIVSPLRLPDFPAKPAFLEEKRLTGAERGTLTHRLLSLIALDALKSAAPERLGDAVKEEAHSLVERGVLTARELLALPLESVERFFAGELGRRLLQSDTVRREWSFNLLLDDGVTLLQGVIDCAFVEKDAWVLADYKTDRIEDEDAFIERYRLQLDWYARALERITGRPVTERWLVALSTGKAYAVDKP